MVVPPESLGRALSDAGAPARFSELDPPIPEERARWAVEHCHLMRDRFTLADLLFFLGRWNSASVDELFGQARLAGGGL